MFRLIQISESARKLSDKYRDQHPNVPWTAMSGLRNRIVHDYEGVRLDVVWETIHDDFPQLLTLLESTGGRP